MDIQIISITKFLTFYWNKPFDKAIITIPGGRSNSSNSRIALRDASCFGLCRSDLSRHSLARIGLFWSRYLKIYHIHNSNSGEKYFFEWKAYANRKNEKKNCIKIQIYKIHNIKNYVKFNWYNLIWIW